MQALFQPGLAPDRAAIAESGDRHCGRAAREARDYHRDYSDGLLAAKVEPRLREFMSA
jgi:hypothetical protein